MNGRQAGVIVVSLLVVLGVWLVLLAHPPGQASRPHLPPTGSRPHNAATPPGAQPQVGAGTGGSSGTAPGTVAGSGSGRTATGGGRASAGSVDQEDISESDVEDEPPGGGTPIGGPGTGGGSGGGLVSVVVSAVPKPIATLPPVLPSPSLPIH